VVTRPGARAPTRAHRLCGERWWVWVCVVTWPGAKDQTDTWRPFALLPWTCARAMCWSGCGGAFPRGGRAAVDVAGGWLTGGIGGVAGIVVGVSLGAMDVSDVGKSEPGALGCVPEAGGMATLLGDVAATVWGREGARDVTLVHMVSRELWGGVG